MVSVLVGAMDGHNVRLNSDLAGLLHYVVGGRCARLLADADHCGNVRRVLECEFVCRFFLPHTAINVFQLTIRHIASL